MRVAWGSATSTSPPDLRRTPTMGERNETQPSGDDRPAEARQDEAARRLLLRVDSSVPPVPPLKRSFLGGALDIKCTSASHEAGHLSHELHPQGISGNFVRTAKYTALTFLPINLFEQFSRIGNQYFAFISALQLIPGLSPTSWFTTVFPLSCVLLANMVKELYDDHFRGKADNDINNRQVEVIRSDGPHQSICWQDLRVGDVIRVLRDKEFPADLLFLASGDSEGNCYVETANLDGETNLKIKTRPGCCEELEKAPEQSIELFANTHHVEAELPNERLYTFEGAIVSSSTGHRFGLDASALLLRGCILRKTPWVIGVVVYAGLDTRIHRNDTKAPRKVTQLEKTMNLLVLLMFGMLFFMALVSAALNQVYMPILDANYYFLQFDHKWPNLGPGIGGYVVAVMRFVILYNQLIPISLYVSLEVVKVVQCFVFLNFDQKMYHAPSDTYFNCRSTTLNEDLGQVGYVLSDKTGTLTENLMSFVWCSINGELYGKDSPEDQDGAPSSASEPSGSSKAAALKHPICGNLPLRAALSISGSGQGDKSGTSNTRADNFMLALAVCNSVVPHVDGKEGEEKLVYQAESPDEEALVEGAADLGARLLQRATGKCNLKVGDREMCVEVGATFDFSSDRKRMSIVGRLGDGSCQVWCKGADNVVLDRLGEEQHCLDATQHHLGEMSRAGFRTLCVAQRTLTEAEYQKVVSAFDHASASLEDREGTLAKVAREVEHGLTLLGATAVEDKLQDGVPETIASLLQAGIRVWVLTGDKLETAISIAVSCQLFGPTMPLVVIKGGDLNGGAEAAKAVLQDKLQKATVCLVFPSGEKVGLVIDGKALTAALDEEVQEAFLSLCHICHSIVCCRVSPRQKAHVTEMVKARLKATTLAIGDGANDVGMIQAAHIGCGISGREGRAALMASDFSFAKFCFLKRLLFVHGHWSFRRNEQVVMYNFYKNVAYVLGNFYFAFFTAFSAQPLYDPTMIGTYNLFWTSLPSLVYALTEQTLLASTLMDHPELYSETSTAGRRQVVNNFVLWMVSGVWHSLMNFFIPALALGLPSDYGVFTLGGAVYTACIFTVNLKMTLITHFYTWVMHVCIFVISIGFWFAVFTTAGILYDSAIGDSLGIALLPGLYGVPLELFQLPGFWFGAVLLAPFAALLPDFLFKATVRTFFPTPTDIYQEAERIEAKEGKGGAQPPEVSVSHPEASSSLTPSSAERPTDVELQLKASSSGNGTAPEWDPEVSGASSLPAVETFLSRCGSIR